MTTGVQDDVTALLVELRSGRADTLPRLTERIYPELRSLAQQHLRREAPGHLLQPTALVNEAYLRLVAHDAHDWQSRAHFFGAASHIMRRILVDYARAQRAKKRDDGRTAVPLADVEVATADRGIDLLALDEALDALERLSARQARIVHLRYFAGLSVREIAQLLDVTPRTVDRDWTAARAWLRLRLT